MRVALLSALLLGALTLAAAGQGASSPSCAVRHAGPGAPPVATDRGALCLLRAFDDGCRRASYGLSLFGVDTIARDSFSLRARAGGCDVLVVASFEVVPNRKRLSSGVCRAWRKRSGDVLSGRAASGRAFRSASR